jgi:type II secretion system protein J
MNLRPASAIFLRRSAAVCEASITTDAHAEGPVLCGRAAAGRDPTDTLPFIIGIAGRSRHLQAFTLVELLVSSALMSAILVSAYLCLRAVISGQDLVESRAEVIQTARVAMALMTADLRCATPLSEEFEFLGMSRVLGDMKADNLDFGTHNYTPQRRGEGDFIEVSYYLDKNQETGRFSLWRRRDSSPDAEPLSGGAREEIAAGVRGLRFEYFDGFDWYTDWGDPQGRRRGQTQQLESSFLMPNLSGMPEAVRITLWMDPQTEKRTDTENGKEEPPLMFDTIVRLNLARRTWDGSPTTGGDGSGAQGLNSQPMR